MVDYTFSSLNDKEFENLSIDILSTDKNKRFERFKAGRDRGIDGRYYNNNGLEDIIQCKHYLQTGFQGLISSLKRKNNKGINEVEKVKLLKPKNYYFITSLPLSSENKKTIKNLFTPFIKNDNDIYGQEDLNDLLKKFPDIEKNHYKLWLSSTNVLMRLLNNAIEGRSESYLEDINEKLHLYVNTSNHKNALEILKESNALIITGEPGIGKTTLTENLCYFYSSQGYKFYLINKDIEEVENIYSKDTKQVFYFDDFLGSNFLNAIEHKHDSSIMQFISRVKKDSTKKFILTSRTNIINQAYMISSIFKNKNIHQNEFVLTIDGLTDFNKAEILYNHIWFSSLPESFIDVIYENRRYMQIIKHKNFNPRLIAFITNKNNFEDIEPSNFWNYVLSILSNPSEVWSHTFDCQSDDFIRNIILLIVFNNNSIDEKLLNESYNYLNKITKATSTSNINNQFNNVIKTTVKYFVNRNMQSPSNINYTLFNPSLADFIMNRYKGDIELLKLIYLSLQTKSSISNLISLEKNNFIDKQTYQEILSYLFQEYDIKDNKNEYFLSMSLLIIRDKYIDHKVEFDNKIKAFLNTIDIVSNNGIYFTDLLKLLVYATKEFNYQIDLKELLNSTSIDEIDDLPLIIEIFNNLNLTDKTFITDFENSLQDALIDALSDFAHSEIDISAYITRSPLDYYDFDIDESSIKDVLHDFIDDLVIEFDTDTININSDDIVDSIDIDSLINSYFSSQGDGYDEDRYRERQLLSNDIDDLFER
ncbi:MAG: hypothetical protein R3331_01530 [Sulfurospirillaceae bacterium]|nr:hypothetical protein [Sulfurospirillaceae bacterium]